MSRDDCAAHAKACIELARIETIAPVKVMLDHIAGTWDRIAKELQSHNGHGRAP